MNAARPNLAENSIRAGKKLHWDVTRDSPIISESNRLHNSTQCAGEPPWIIGQGVEHSRLSVPTGYRTRVATRMQSAMAPSHSGELP